MYTKRPMAGLIGAALTFSLLAAGCSADTSSDSTQETTAPTAAAEYTPPAPGDRGGRDFFGDPAQTAVSAELPEYEALARTTDIAALFTERDLDGHYDSITAEIRLDGRTASVTGTGAAVDGGVITITDEGTYRISGTLEEGRIHVNSPGKVQLLLAGASVHCSDFAPIYIEQAKKAFITTESGTVNSISDGADYVWPEGTESEPDAAIFSRDSLTLNGSGTLLVTGLYNEGITCKDDLVITDGTLQVTAAGNGIKGKDYIAVAGGDITVEAGGDGMKSDNLTDAGMGFVYVQDGRIQITAAEDGIQADTELLLDGGSLTVTAGGGIANAVPHTEDFGGRGGWGGGFFGEETTQETEETSPSTKALKAGTLLAIAGGSHSLEAADDGLHANGDLSLTGGTVEILAGGDGIHADGRADFSSGSVTITQSYEGIEAAVIRCLGADISLTASDDGFNASDGTAQGGMGTYSEGCCLVMADGMVYVNAGGDGLDSNGLFFVTGGTVHVDGPTNSGNGALDANSAIQCTGGELIAAGMSGMAEYPQGSHTLVITLDTVQEGGTPISVRGDDGSTLTYTPAKRYNSVVIRSDQLQAGIHYIIYTGESEAGSVDMTEETTFFGEAGGMMGGWQQGGFHGGRGGRGDWMQEGEMDGTRPARPDGMTPPGGMTPA
ncbi:MAG: carbohydrate-binding domain-containing protein, partial [Oscillospiraceae bacterium]|nr:carbohydrate-binding domain-containing protein [Oscillospiraceae bacterium]